MYHPGIYRADPTAGSTVAVYDFCRMKIHRGAGEVGAERRALPFKVFIGYADVSAVRRATSTIADAVRGSGRRFEIQPMLWRFSQLISSHWHDRAITAALDADIIVLASSNSADLSQKIEEWVDAYLAARHGKRTTIVAVLGDSDAWTISMEQSRTRRRKVADPVLRGPATVATGMNLVPSRS